MTREWLQDGGNWSQVSDELKVICYGMLSPWDVRLHCTGKAHSPDSQAGSAPLLVPPAWSTEQILSCDITPQHGILVQECIVELHETGDLLGVPLSRFFSVFQPRNVFYSEK